MADFDGEQSSFVTKGAQHSFDPNLEMACQRWRCGLRHFVFCALGSVELGVLDRVLLWGRRGSWINGRRTFGVSIKVPRIVRCPDYTEVPPKYDYNFFRLRVVVVFLCQLCRASYFHHCAGSTPPHAGVPPHLYSRLRTDIYPMETLSVSNVDSIRNVHCCRSVGMGSEGAA